MKQARDSSLSTNHSTIRTQHWIPNYSTTGFKVNKEFFSRRAVNNSRFDCSWQLNWRWRWCHFILLCQDSILNLLNLSQKHQIASLCLVTKFGYQDLSNVSETITSIPLAPSSPAKYSLPVSIWSKLSSIWEKRSSLRSKLSSSQKLIMEAPLLLQCHTSEFP